MSDKSPLFVSTLELLAHATELYAEANTKKYKFIILHLSNAAELILKDCLVGKGVSIYERDGKRTITPHTAFNKLKDLGISIPEQPAIELLIDDRNNIQHRFGSPEPFTVFYYIEKMISFLKHFFEEHYNTQLAEELKPYLLEEHIALLGLIEGDYSHFKKHFEVSPQAAVLQACKTIETEIEDYMDPISTEYTLWTLPFPIIIHRLRLPDLIEKKYISDDIVDGFVILKNARNQIPTPLASETKVDWKSALDTAIQFLTGLNKAKEDDIFGLKSKSDSDEMDKSK